MATETFQLTETGWFNLSTKLSMTFTVGKSYMIQPIIFPVRGKQDTTIGNGVEGLLSDKDHPLKFTYKTGDIISLSTTNVPNYIVVSEIN